jgi:hypothetical protein
MIQFPFNTSNFVLKGPEKDYEMRPKNLKPKISVLFAFNSNGDYIEPYFVYPHTFKIDKQHSQLNEQEGEGEEEEEEDKISFECSSQNGYVTAEVFRDYINNCFTPSLINKQRNVRSTKRTNNDIVLLYCGKLAIIDCANLKLCSNKTERKPFQIHLFALNDPSVMPFNSLFEKTMRKRQIDIFSESWRKLSLPNMNKCTNTKDFSMYFNEALNNCIDDIATEYNPLNKSENGSNYYFKTKMIDCFNKCKLWPLKYDDYEVFLQNNLKKLNPNVKMEPDAQLKSTLKKQCRIESDSDSTSTSTSTFNPTDPIDKQRTKKKQKMETIGGDKDDVIIKNVVDNIIDKIGVIEENTKLIQNLDNELFESIDKVRAFRTNYNRKSTTTLTSPHNHRQIVLQNIIKEVSLNKILKREESKTNYHPQK